MHSANLVLIKGKEMKTFEVKFESPGFVETRKHLNKIEGEDAGLTKSFCDGFNSQTIKDGELPSGVVEVVSGSIREDDGQGSSDIKVFASITLLIEAENQNAAGSFEPPVNLLTILVDAMSTVNDQCLVSLDGAWEITNIGASEMKKALPDVGLSIVLNQGCKIPEKIWSERPNELSTAQVAWDLLSEDGELATMKLSTKFEGVCKDGFIPIAVAIEYAQENYRHLKFAPNRDVFKAKATFPEQKNMAELLVLWKQLGDVPTVFTGESVDTLEESFLHFSAGTHREEVWKWFEQQNPGFIVGDVMNGIRSNDVIDSYDQSYKDAEKIAYEKGKLTVFDTCKNQSHQGRLIGVTDHHAVISLGRSAFTIDRGPLNVEDLGQDLKVTFNGPKISIAPIEKNKDKGIGGR